MALSEVNPYDTPLTEDLTRFETSLPNVRRSVVSGIGTARVAYCLFLVCVGIIFGLIAMPLISNKYGNTDTIGLGLLGLSGWMVATGVAYLFKRFAIAAFIGVVAAPLPIVALFMLFWLLLIVFALGGAAMQS
jgi:hypothetical protein